MNIAQNGLTLTLSGLGDDLIEGLGPLSDEAVGVFEDSIEHRYYALDEVPSSVSLQPAAAGR